MKLLLDIQSLDAIKRRRKLEKLGIGMPGDNTHILEVARSLREKVDAPVLGGVAVYLHGVGTGKGETGKGDTP
jgi:hypothetical protein